MALACDDRYGCPDSFALVRCKGCGHTMTSPSLTEAELPALYSRYYPRKQTDTSALLNDAAMVGSTRARLSRWLSGSDNQGQYRVRPGQFMLDVGCGSGLSLLEAARLGAQAFGIEADPNVRPIAEQLGLTIHIGTLRDQPFPDTSFDLIVVNQVIEHMPEPDKALECLRGRLKPGGRIVLSFPNRRSAWQRLSRAKWINWHIPYHLHHFDAAGFETMARRQGYRVVRLRTITPNAWTILQLRSLATHPRAGVASPLWAVGAAPAQSAQQQSRLAPERLLRTSVKLIAWASLVLLNRAIDLAGYGDSIIVELAVEART
jgi:SAM-dependent methyltransferase